MISLVLAVVCIADVPRLPVEESRVDVLEVNHYYDPNTADLRFVQLIGWDWCNKNGMVCHWWRMIRNPARQPRSDASRPGVFVATFVDDGKLVRVRARCCIETHTQFDPEIDNRRVFPQWRRRGLILKR